MKFIVGTKVGMSQIFDKDGNVTPVTVIAAPAVTVTQVKTNEKDGYAAVQVGVGTRREKNVNKPQRAKGLFAKLKEFRPGDNGTELAVGSTVDAGTFAEGDVVTISAVSKGKGFQGVVKRHGFHGGRRTHGQKHSEREAGSIGGGPGRAGGRVVKGLKMAGRMGNERVTIKNVRVVKVDAVKNEIFLKGAVPGRRGTYVEIVSA